MNINKTPVPVGGRRIAVPLAAQAAVSSAAVALLLVGCGASETAPELPTKDAGSQVESGSAAGASMTPKQVYEQNLPSTVHILTSSGTGSGFVVDAKKGIVASNAHVTGGRGPLQVVTSTGDKVAARRLGVAPCEDLAVIQLNTVPDGLTEVTMGDSGKLEAQDEVTVIGFPASLDANSTDRSQQAVSSSGHVQVAHLDADAGTSLPLYVDAIQHDGVVNPGNSGGPLFNDHGELVGINSLSNSSAARVEGQYYAISSNHATPIIQQLEHGVTYSDIGLHGSDLQEISDEVAGQVWPNGGLPSEFAAAGMKAFVVTDVESGSAADEAKIFPADVITKVGGEPVSSFSEICSVLASTTPGDAIPVEGVYMMGTTESAVYDPWKVNLRLKSASSETGGEVTPTSGDDSVPLGQ
jgi:S1-C subfamily serine protease